MESERIGESENGTNRRRIIVKPDATVSQRIHAVILRIILQFSDRWALWYYGKIDRG